MRISSRANELIITIPNNLFDVSEIQEIIDFLRYKTLVSKSQATPQDIDELVKEINKELAHLNKEFIH